MPAENFGTDQQPHLPNQRMQSLLFQWSMETCPIGVIIVTHEGQVTYANPKFSSLCGQSRERLYAASLTQLAEDENASPSHLQLWQALMEPKDQILELDLTNKKGQNQWHRATIFDSFQDETQINYTIAYLEDITEKKENEQTIEHLALYDQLTDLPNRAMFNSRLKLALKQAERTGEKVAVILVDLDRFKTINDTLGHNIGDDFIKMVGHRLFNCLSENDVVARMGGDEFMIMLPALHDFKNIFKIIQKLMDAFIDPFQYENQQLHIKASMGISIYPDDGDDALALIKNADSALYEAKYSGRNHYKFYTAKLNATAFEQLTMETALRQALYGNQFMVYYQPQLDIATGKIIGMEALVRWKHPEMGIIPPIQFIPLAEETGLIVPLGSWVLKTACMQTVTWKKMGFDHLRLAVNLSARQFQEPELVETILNICTDVGMPPQSLELEITESILMKDITIAIMILKWLNKKGIRIAIDDFGTGYSSLSYLKKFPLNHLKIDRSFIRDCINNKDDAAIISCIVSIANNLHLKIIAEGVETKEQLAFVRSIGCHQFQGYYFSPPVPAEEFTAMLQNGKSIPSD